MNEYHSELPTPEELEREFEATPRKINLRSYYRPISLLKEKGYNFTEIADMMSTRLGVDITRSQISYLLTTPADVLAEDEDAEQAEAEADAEDAQGK